VHCVNPTGIEASIARSGKWYPTIAESKPEYTYK